MCVCCKQNSIMSTILSIVFLWNLSIFTSIISASTFLSSEQNISVTEGEDAEFVCIIGGLEEGQIVFWLNGTIVLSAQEQIFYERVRLVVKNNNEYRLIINRLNVWDEGRYSCQVPGSSGTIIQTHQLTVTIPPLIQFYPDLDKVTINEFDSLKLECRGFGKPQPTVVWSKFGGKFRNDSQHIYGEVLEIPIVERKDGGVYECTASNNVGYPMTRTVQIEVEFAPTITVLETLIYSSPGMHVLIECHFQANPPVEILWYINNKKIEVQSRSNMLQSHHKHKDSDSEKWSLSIQDIDIADFGLYMCSGENKLGITFATVYVSPDPHDLEITSGSTSQSNNQYTLEWTVNSRTKLEEFIIAYKLLNDSVETEWRNISVPASHRHHHSPLHSQSYVFNKLASSSNYTVMLLARNQYGYSDWTDKFYFHTLSGLATKTSSLTSIPLAVLLLRILLF